MFGLQFHPEVDLTDQGKEMMIHFLFDVAKCKGTFTMQDREAECLKYIKEVTGNHKVLVCASAQFSWISLLLQEVKLNLVKTMSEILLLVKLLVGLGMNMGLETMGKRGVRPKTLNEKFFTSILLISEPL